MYDPQTTRTGPNGALMRDSFPGRVFPLARQDPVALAIQKFIPLPTNPAPPPTTTAEPTYTDNQNTTNISVKLDHSLSPTIKISGYYRAF